MAPIRALCVVLGLAFLLSCGGDSKLSSAPSPLPATPAASFTVTGTVRNPAGAPIEGASVTGGAIFSKTGPRFLATSDAAGRYQGTLPNGTHQFSITKPGFSTVSLDSVVVAGDTVVDVALVPGVNVSGLVTELGVGALNDVTIEVVSGPNAGVSALTGRGVEGRYFFDRLVPGELRIRASKQGYDPVEQVVDATTNATADFTLRWAYGSCLRSVAPVLFDAFPSAGGSQTVSVEANAGRAWTATADAPWIQVASPAGQTGSGHVTFQVLGHAIGAREERRGAVMVRCGAAEGQNVWIVQRPDCQVRLTPTANSQGTFSAAGGTGTLKLEVGIAGCHWQARSLVDWIHTVGINSWRGALDPGVSFVVRPNTTGVARTGQFVVGDTVWQVAQQ